MAAAFGYQTNFTIFCCLLQVSGGKIGALHETLFKNL